MRLHHLAVTAFGPFPTSVEIDFDEVCSAGLFLIHGATGSGKTSLLDAICFALFADVPGARTKKGLASHHAAEGTQPLVTLELTVGGRRLRITRSPEFHRPKKRGTGLLKVNATVALEEYVGGVWQGISTRHDEVADVIDQVLGMGLAQFAKVVVLPQGDVAAFLRSSPEERRVLLEKLFDISTYTDVETWFVEERRRTGAAVLATEESIARELGRLDDLLEVGGSTAADWGEDESAVEGGAEGKSSVEDGAGPGVRWSEFWMSAEPATLLDQLDRSVEQLSERVSTLLAEADAAEAACGAASARLADVRRLGETRARGLRAQAAHQRALAVADEITALRAVVARAQSAAAVSGHLHGLDAAVAEEARCSDQVTAGRQALGATWSTADLHEVAERLHAADPMVAELVQSTAEEVRAAEAVSVAEGARKHSSAALATARERTDAARVAVEQAEGALVACTAEAADLPAAEAAHHRALEQITFAEQLVALRQARAAAGPELVAAQQALLEAQDRAITTRQRRLDGMAAELAGALDQGDACPVCGSLEHPAPAQLLDPVTPEEVDSAEAALEQARSVHGELQEQDTAALVRIQSVREALRLSDDEEPDLEGLDEERASLDRRVEAARAAARELPAARALVEAARVELERASTVEAAASESAVSARTTHEAARAVIDDVQARVQDLLTRHAAECGCAPPAEGSQDPVATAQSHATLVAALDRVIGAERLHAEAGARRRDLETAAAAVAIEHGFVDAHGAADFELVRESLMSAEDVARHQGRIAEHDQLRSVAAATLAEEGVSDALAGPEPDLSGAEAAEVAARRALRRSQSAHSAAEGRLVTLRTVVEEVGGQVESLTALRERAAAVRQLADAVTGTGGGNTLRMRLSSFVLAARLEKVVALANERLHTMDSGRYLLEHSDAKVSGNARSGLDLRILDQWTGRTRETASLSGGESFMVSLALALGLADAVREESGGFDLGTLFVDEGFGTLDDDSLEHVMGVLDGLREGGRAVGVVSHVADLRTRITHQVVVEKSTSGSTVRVETASVAA